MIRRLVRNEPRVIARRCAPVLFLLSGLLVLTAPSQAQIDLGPVTVGAGLRTSFVNTTPDSGNSTQQFELNDIRLYVNGPVYKDIKFMFNTDYNSVTNSVQVLDAVARIEVSPEFNIWMGRFLPPSDRANLYGPFYAHEWNVYTDGIQDGYPFVFQGRDNGVTYWGTFAKKVKVSIGGFDGRSATGTPDLIGAARVQIDFWDPEDGYYLNGTYYGDKNLLAIGGASQLQDGHTASTVDFLMERKLPNMGGVVSIEAEYSDYNRLGGYNAAYAKSQGAYILGSYLFAKKVGVGQFEILGKYAKAEFTHGATPSYNQKTGEVNFNYVIKQFNARVQSFYQTVRFNRQNTDFWEAGVGLQVQM
ncbi:MAG TPA: hypothetical protein VLY24_07655 [Bryobacteraceae bacterium]|nr:hypothetical protein [Bryobacteraceae bacterium]